MTFLVKNLKYFFSLDFKGFENVNIYFMRFLKVLDNSLFSVFFTSILSHFEPSQKKSYLHIQKGTKPKRKKHIKFFFTRKIKRIFLVGLLFSILFFFLYHQTTPILGSILYIIWFKKKLFGKDLIYFPKKIKFLSFK